MEKSKVYILIVDGIITRIDGGYSISNISDISEWTYIDEGYGDKYNLCQSHYLDKSIIDETGVYNYKYVDGEIVERTEAEKEADRHEHEEEPTQLDRIEAQVMFTALMTDTLIEEV